MFDKMKSRISLVILAGLMVKTKETINGTSLILPSAYTCISLEYAKPGVRRVKRNLIRRLQMEYGHSKRFGSLSYYERSCIATSPDFIGRLSAMSELIYYQRKIPKYDHLGWRIDWLKFIMRNALTVRYRGY